MSRPARRRRAVVAAALLATAVVAVPSAPAAALPKALTQGTPQFAVRPAEIDYTGDSSGVVGGPRTAKKRFGSVTWSSWTTRSARGRGLVWTNDCTPNCAAGTFRSHPVRVALTRPSGGRFLRLTLHYSAAGRRITDVRRVERHGRAFAYGIVRQTGF